VEPNTKYNQKTVAGTTNDVTKVLTQLSKEKRENIKVSDKGTNKSSDS
jgi:hypothetical protein